MQQTPEAITFSRLIEEWERRDRSDLGTQLALKNGLISPEVRGWWQACRQAARNGEVETIREWLDLTPSSSGGSGTGRHSGVVKWLVFDDEHLPMVRVHLECALLAAELIRLPVPGLEVAEAMSAATRAADELGKAWNQTGRPVGDWKIPALTQALLSRRWPEESATKPTGVSDAVFECLRPALQHPDEISLAFLKDLTHQMMSPPEAIRGGRHPLNTSVAPALFTRFRRG